MPFFTVQCSFASYDAKTVVVEAETIEQALDRAIVAANEGDGWSSLDVCGDSFVARLRAIAAFQSEVVCASIECCGEAQIGLSARRLRGPPMATS